MLSQIARFPSFFMAELTFFCVCVYVCINHIFFIHSAISGHLAFFSILAIINNAAMNIGVHISFLVSVFIFFG